MSQKNTEYLEINIRTNAGAIDDLIKMGVNATPALMVGDKVLVGFDPGKIDQAIAEVEARSDLNIAGD